MDRPIRFRRSAVEAIRKLRENGHLAFINTGTDVGEALSRESAKSDSTAWYVAAEHIFIMKEKRCLATAFCMKNVRKSYMSCADSASRHFLAEEHVYYDSRCMSPELGTGFQF